MPSPALSREETILGIRILKSELVMKRNYEVTGTWYSEVTSVVEYQILTKEPRRKCDNLGISVGDTAVLGFIITNTLNTNEALVPGYWPGSEQ